MKTIRKINVIGADPPNWLKQIDEFKKKNKVLHEISNVAMMQVANPLFGKNGLHMPGQPQYTMQAIIISAIIYEVEVKDDFIEAPVINNDYLYPTK